MNCKPGDLAVIVGGAPGADRNVGSLVNVLRAYEGSSEPSWWVVSRGRGLVDHKGGYHQSEVGCYDRCLRPIRDQDGEDEILRLVGKPEKEAA